MGTLVRVRCDVGTTNGEGFANGSDYRCGFDAGDQRSVSHATRVAADELRCHAPRAHAPGGVDFRVALNGQQYGLSLPFDFLPRPEAHGLEPRTGIFEGSTRVNVSGINFSNRTQISCRFGTAGVGITPATFVSSTLVTCAAPHGDTVDLESEWESDFAEPTDFYTAAQLALLPPPPPSSPSAPATPPGAGRPDWPPHGGVPLLLGNATVGGGLLRLTDTRQYQTGGLVLTPLTRGVRYFRATFSARLSGGSGGDGFSFCYGELNSTLAFGEMGTRNPLALVVGPAPPLVVDPAPSRPAPLSLPVQASMMPSACGCARTTRSFSRWFATAPCSPRSTLRAGASEPAPSSRSTSTGCRARECA